MTRSQNFFHIALGIIFETALALLLIGWSFFICFLVFFTLSPAP